MLGQQAAVQQRIGRGDGLHFGQTHLLDQAILGGAERAFHLPLGLGLRARISSMSNSRRARPNCGLRIRQGLALVLGLEDAVPVGVQRQRPAEAAQPAAQQVHVVEDGVGLVEACQQAAGGVVDHADQHHVLAAPFGPVVDRGVHLHQLAEAGATRPPAAVSVAVPLSLPQPLGEQPAAQVSAGRPPGRVRPASRLAKVGPKSWKRFAVSTQDLACGVWRPCGGWKVCRAGRGRGRHRRRACSRCTQSSDLRGVRSSNRAASAWVRSPRRTACMTMRTSRSFWLMEIRSAAMDVDRHGSSLAWARRTFLSR